MPEPRWVDPNADLQGKRVIIRDQCFAIQQMQVNVAFLAQDAKRQDNPDLIGKAEIDGLEKSAITGICGIGALQQHIDAALDMAMQQGYNEGFQAGHIKGLEIGRYAAAGEQAAEHPEPAEPTDLQDGDRVLHTAGRPGEAMPFG